MISLEEPIKKYLTGKLPSHSSTNDLHKNFKGLTRPILFQILIDKGYLQSNFKPTRKALDDELLNKCGSNVIWSLDKVQFFLESGGLNIERCFVNQELPVRQENVTWANLGTIGTYFNVTGPQIGKWLTSIGWRDETGEPVKQIIDDGIVQAVEMNAGGKKTRKIFQWDLHSVIEKLVEQGHPLDFDYEKNLIGKGKNGNVVVETVETRAKEFIKTFVPLYKNPETREESFSLVKKTPRGIQLKSEELLGKPGFFTEKLYIKSR